VTPGPPAYLTVKTKGDCSMPRKREQSEGAYDWDLQGPLCVYNRRDTTDAEIRVESGRRRIMHCLTMEL